MKNLNETQTKLLYSVRNQIEIKEFDERKIRADLTLSKLADKYTGEYASRILEDLSTRLQDVRLMSLVGITNITKVILSGHIKNKTIKDLFSVLLKNLENEELYAVNLSNSGWKIGAINIGLNFIYKSNILDHHTKNVVFNLINNQNHTYRVMEGDNGEWQEKTSIRPFKHTLEWISQYGDPLIIDLNFGYIKNLLHEIHEDNNEIDIDDSINQIKLIFNTFKNDKHKDRQFLEQLATCLSHKNEKIVDFAVNYIKESNCLDIDNSKYIDHIISAYAQRIFKEINKDINLLKCEEHCNYLLELLASHGSKIANVKDSNTSKIISDLILELSYAMYDDTVDMAIKLTNITYGLYPDAIDKIFKEWLQYLFIDVNDESEHLLDERLVKLIAQNYIENNKSSDNNYLGELKKQLKEYIEPSIEELPKTVQTQYEILMKHLSETAKQNEVIVKHLSNIYASLEESLEQEYFEYFSQTFKIIVNFFSYKIDANLDSLLLKIKTNHLDTFSELTNDMYLMFTDNWPKADSTNLPNYKPLEIFNYTTKEYLDKNNKSVDAILLFKSMYSMYKNSVINDNYDNKSRLVSSAFELWRVDVDLASKILEEFSSVTTGYNYEVLFFRNGEKDIEPLKKMWSFLMNKNCQKDKNALIKKTESFLNSETYINSKYMPLWMECLYKELNDLNPLNQAILKVLNSDKCDFLLENREKVIKLLENNLNNNTELKESLAKDLLNFYLNSNDGNTKLRIARWIRDLTSKNASNIINKRTVSTKTSKQYPKDVVSLKKIFDENAPLINMHKEIIAKKKTKKRKTTK